MKKYKKGKILLAAGGVCTILVVVILAVSLYQPKEIDQKVLFIYRHSIVTSKRGVFYNLGYFIDNHGNKVEFNFTAPVENEWVDETDDTLLQELNAMEVTESTPTFSAGEMAKLYRYLYQIDGSQETECENWVGLGRHVLLGVRYKENGEAEIIKLFEAGRYYGENPDPYAKKIKTALLQKEPIYAN